MTQVFFWSFSSGYGMTSRLNRNSGTQKEWMTSFDSWVNAIGRSVGSTRIGTELVVPTTEAGSPLGAMVCG